jgi:diguanylate cyclase (GGDEF)-like protein/PAS domain S-box-containing protein
MKSPSFSLRARLLVGVIAIVLATTLGLTTVSLHHVKRTMQESIANDQFERISAIADAVDQKFISRRVLLRTFSDSVATHRFADNAALQQFLEAHRASLKQSFDNVAFLDLNGNLAANLNGATPVGKVNVADRAYFIDTVAAMAGVISQPYRNRLNGLPQIAITEPVFDEQGKVAYVISGSINLKEQNFLGELATVKFGKTGYMFITNTHGIVIDHPSKDRILNHSDADAGHNPATAAAIAGFEGTTSAMNRAGVYGLYAFKRIRQTNWVLGCIYPRSEAFEEIEDIERLAWAGAALLAVLAGALTYTVLQSQLAPLLRLHDHMQSAREMREYRPFPEAAPQREIGDMARTFDTLMFERQTAQQRLRDSANALSDVLTHAPDAFVSIDSMGLVTEWNRQAEATFGWTRPEMLGMSMANILIPAPLRAQHDAGMAAFLHTGTGPIVDRRVEVNALHKDGHEIPVELSVAAVRQGDIYVANAFLRDITERKAGEALLAASEKRVRDIADHVPALIGYFDAELRMQFANGPARRLFGIDPTREYDMQTAMGEDTYRLHAPHLPKVLAGEAVTFEEATGLGGGKHFQAHMVPDLAADGHVKGFYIMTFDVSDLKRAELKLLEQTRIDPLTGLPNRRRFLEILDQALARSKRNGSAMAIMFLDVDAFKAINDTHGHGVGDEVLIGFANRLKTSVRETDTVARLAGDEFVIILEGLRPAEAAELVAAKIVQSLQTPVALERESLRVTSSIGIAVVEAIEPGHHSAFARLEQMTAKELIAQADEALYAAKRAGRNRYAMYEGA